MAGRRIALDAAAAIRTRIVLLLEFPRATLNPRSFLNARTVLSSGSASRPLSSPRHSTLGMLSPIDYEFAVTSADEAA
jgi:hypothetical protein